ncbi:MAG: ABC transporter substrate-binding protein [candidate division WOR-3 bacterium]|nr:ABC transporter substrate-binding protein [candidate division WOR-3 bacterium]
MSYKKVLAVLLMVGMVGVIFIGEAISQGKNQVKIGVIEPLTGPCSLEGGLTVSGIKMATEEINAKGGPLGIPIHLYIEDGKAIPGESVSAVEKLIVHNKVSVVIGAWASSATLAIIPICEKYKVPLVVETSAHPGITMPRKDWVFRTKATAQIDAKALEEHLIGLGFSKPVFLSVNNDWGRSVANTYAKAIERQGGTIQSHEYYSAGETNFYSILTKVKNSGANSLIITADVNAVSIICRQSLELGMKVKKMVTSGFSAALILKLAGADASEGLYVVDCFPYYSPPPELAEEMRSFVERYQKRFPGKVLQSNVIFGYIPVYMIVDAVKKAGSADRAKIRDALEEVTYDGVTGHLEFDENHQVYPYIFVVHIENGKPVILITVAGKP